MGAVSAGAGQDKIDALGRYGLKLGLAFQIIDDLLDVTSTPEAMGKNTQKDTDAGKLTYPALVGLDESRLLADKYMTEAFAELDLLGEAGESLRQLATMLSERKA
jgi:geranylgeranyl diphosphate synthase type II